MTGETQIAPSQELQFANFIRGCQFEIQHLMLNVSKLVRNKITAPSPFVEKKKKHILIFALKERLRAVTDRWTVKEKGEDGENF